MQLPGRAVVFIKSMDGICEIQASIFVRDSDNLRRLGSCLKVDKSYGFWYVSRVNHLFFIIPIKISDGIYIDFSRDLPAALNLPGSQCPNWPCLSNPSQIYLPKHLNSYWNNYTYQRSTESARIAIEAILFYSSIKLRVSTCSPMSRSMTCCLYVSSTFWW